MVTSGLRCVLLSAALALGASACGSDGPPAEAQAYDCRRERLEAIASVRADLRGDVQAKLAEFATARKSAGDDGKAIGAVTERMAAYENGLHQDIEIAQEPAATPPPSTAADVTGGSGAREGSSRDRSGSSSGRSRRSDSSRRSGGSSERGHGGHF